MSKNVEIFLLIFRGFRDKIEIDRKKMKKWICIMRVLIKK